MKFSPLDLAHLLCTLSVLLVAAHGIGYVFQKARQPIVIGEILAGILLGPSCLKLFAPNVSQFLFFENGPTAASLGMVYNLGLLLLMFSSGMEMESSFKKNENKTALFISIAGTVIPFLLSFILLQFIDLNRHIGSAANPTAFTMVFAIAVAVTSIPVISRILFDLNILNTSFARIVLSSALIEDVVLYILLSIALAMVGTGEGASFGVPTLLHLNPTSMLGIAYHIVVTGSFFATSLLLGPRLFSWLESFRFNLPRRRSPIGFLLLVMLFFSGMATMLGVAPMLGAFAGGIVARKGKEGAGESREAIKEFSFAFFIPIYFAIVGLKLDLIHHFNLPFFIWFFLSACVIKFVGIYSGARFAGEKSKAAFNLAVAMNARGGPGIVLASLALDAHVINEGFYTVLVMLAIVTSLLTGSWLGALVRRGHELR